MKKILIILISLMITGVCFAAPMSFEEARELALSQGTDEVEIRKIYVSAEEVIETKYPYKRYRVGGLDENGSWTFYTIKAYTTAETTVIIIYKPDYGFVTILRKDDDMTWMIQEVNHYSIALMTQRLKLSVGDSLVEVFLGPLDKLIVGKWTFERKEEYRTDACWDITDEDIKKIEGDQI